MRLLLLIIITILFRPIYGQSIFKDTTFIDITIEFYEREDGPISDYDIFLIHDNKDTIINRHINDTMPVQFLLKDTCNYEIALYKPCHFTYGELGQLSSVKIHIPNGTYKKTIPYWKRVYSTRGCCLTHPDPITFDFNQALLDNKNLRTLFDRIKIVEIKPEWKFKFRLISLQTENKSIPTERLIFLKNTIKSLDININQIEFEEKILNKSDPDFKTLAPCVQLLITGME